MHAIVEQMINTSESLSAADGPGDRRALNVEHRLDLIHELHRVSALPVELVDKGHDRCGAHAADIHELDSAFLDALGTVDDHQGRVHRREGAIGILGEVRMPGCIQKVHHVVTVGELHYR